MNLIALARFEIALVSVISKQIISGGIEYAMNCSRRKSRNASSPIVVPDRLIAHMASGPWRCSARHWAMTLNTFSTTQRSSELIRP
ncbi:hypothetical protein D3C80_1658750 [compost metagenome]